MITALALLGYAACAAWCVPALLAPLTRRGVSVRAGLAHEGAHLAHGHHALATVTRGLAAAFPGVPLFTRGAAEVARLAEMSADDTAVRTSGRPTLVAIATGTVVSSTGLPGMAVPRGAMGAAARAVPDRVERLLRLPSPARSAASTATLTLVLTLLAAAPPALTLLLAR